MNLQEKYESLYNEMANSNDIKKMKLFGSVLNEMMERAINHDTSFAEQEIEKLESMGWHQYLTQKEAKSIYDTFDSKYKWSYDVWEKALNSFDLELERKPYFNKYALWVTMNYIYLIHGETIAQKILETRLEEVSTETMVGIVHALALDDLLNKDERFNVRDYFVK